MELQSYISGVFWGITVLSILLTPYAVVFAIYLLARENMFFTLVQEGTAKAVLVNGRFERMLMSFRGHRFNTEAPQEENRWEVVPASQAGRPGPLRTFLSTVSFGLIGGGMFWIGIWPFAQIYQYRFKWSSLEQKKEGDKEPIITFVTKEEAIQVILVRADVYALFLEKVEVEGGVPVDMIFAITAKSVNPYKSLFRIEKWLEATLNQLGSELRRVLGSRTYEDLVSMVKQGHADLGQEPTVRAVLDRVRPEYGVAVELIQLLSLSPDKDFIKATTQKYVAEQEAEAVRARARGEADRVKTVYGAMTANPEFMTIRSLEALKDANLFIGGTTMGDVVKNIQVGVIPPKNQPSQGGT